MNASETIRMQAKGAHDIVEGTMEGVTADECHKTPGGTAHPIGATYAHLVLSEDFIVNMLLRGSTPLVMGEWAGKAGISEPPPMPGGDLFGWANRVKVDLAQVRQYAQAVYKSTDEYIASLSDDAIGQMKDIPGFGNQPIGYFLSIACIIHPSNHVGEISAMKGIQGGKGYPF